jgi:hypothetical protein
MSTDVMGRRDIKGKEFGGSETEETYGECIGICSAPAPAAALIAGRSRLSSGTGLLAPS